jgi:pimeloyl-ACP methyl ester carboxylesterase
MYGLSCSAGIGLALLERALSEAFPPPFSILGDKYVLLFGHSMGSLTTLRMALKLPESTKIKIILVAPAIVGFSPNDGRQTIIAFKEYRASVVNIVAPLVHSVLSFCMPAIRFIRLIFMDMPSYILLKRIIA